MESFLLLGQVPGTTIIITFGTWLTASAIIAGFVLGWQVVSKRKTLLSAGRALAVQAGQLMKRIQLKRLDQAAQ